MTSVRIGKSFSEEVADAVVRTAVATNDRSVEHARTHAPGGLYKAPGGSSAANEEKSLGEQFIKSDGYRGWMDQYGDGGPSQPASVWSPPGRVSMRLGGMRAIVTSADASAGALVGPDYRGLLETGRVRPLSVLNLVTRLQTTSDLPEYSAEVSRVAGAAPVTEADQLAHTGDETATKPEGGLTFERKTVEVKTVALWVPATKRIVADAPQLREYIDVYLREDLNTELEDQIISGTGGAGFTGIFNTTGTQTIGPPGAGESTLHVIRKALTLLQTVARVTPTGVLMHPADAEVLDLLEVNSEENHFLGDPFSRLGVRTVWGVPLVVSEAVSQGFALVGDFRKAVLFDREEVSVSIGTVDADFIRNIVRVLGEVRAGFGVLRPSAFVEVDLVA